MGNIIIDKVFIFIYKLFNRDKKAIQSYGEIMCVSCNEIDILNKAKQDKIEKGNIDIVQLAKSCNIKVIGKELEHDESAYICYNSNTNNFSIYVNPNHCKERQRFSIAHELAHFILHNDKVREFGQVDRQGNYSLSKDEEDAADCLAANILMPNDLVCEHLSKLNINDKTNNISESVVQAIAHEFNVSFYASITKIRSLGFYVRYM